MTLDELIEQAQKLKDEGVPGDIKIITEGCDCHGEADGFKIEKDMYNKDYLLITRE